MSIAKLNYRKKRKNFLLLRHNRVLPLKVVVGTSIACPAFGTNAICWGRSFRFQLLCGLAPAGQGAVAEGEGAGIGLHAEAAVLQGVALQRDAAAHIAQLGVQVRDSIRR